MDSTYIDTINPSEIVVMSTIKYRKYINPDMIFPMIFSYIQQLFPQLFPMILSFSCMIFPLKTNVSTIVNHSNSYIYIHIDTVNS